MTLAGDPHEPLDVASNEIVITCWNCRGLSLAIPCLRKLIDEGSKIIVLSEHWLWPYELHRLNEIHPDYSAAAISDKRLTSTAELTRGCGGIAILWHKSLTVATIDTNSDRICAIQLKSASTVTSIVGVYLPSAGSPLDDYREYLSQLEDVVASLQREGELLILGDFNAHLQYAPSGEISGGNPQGIHLANWLDQYHLYPVSLTNSREGPGYTYHSGAHYTSVDYIIADVSLASQINRSWTAEDIAENVSDHLPLSISLQVHHPIGQAPGIGKDDIIDWDQDLAGDLTALYMRGVQLIVSPALDSTFNSCDDINQEITRVARELVLLAKSTMPLRKQRRKPYIKDQTLSLLCHQNRLARSSWISSGRPRAGSLYEDMKSAKRELKSHLFRCRARVERKILQKRDALFRHGDVKRFKKPGGNKYDGSQIRDGDTLLTDLGEVLSSWEGYFRALSKSRLPNTPSISHLEGEIAYMASQSHLNEDDTLDWDITIEEIEAMMRRIKKGKSPGPDGLRAEHIL